ncbi:cupin-like domain-containing protein [Paraburkholderia sp. BCC1885]|uniref:cupin-like domain-containing protein n=1 Tax=Paraburkholderia sp. BCC1885 TaxID=2562669 RepID=UPI001183D51D|nr:cupin-like domain-containing protein [Paraburkholderia sp. BCC1885]
MSEAAWDLLAARLAEHYVAPPRTAALDLIVSDAAGACRRFTLGRTLEMSALPPVAGQAAARITLSTAVLAAMLADPSGFDIRSAAMLAMGGVRIEGATQLAAYWLQLLKRPSSEGRAALYRARKRAPGALSTVPELDAQRHDAHSLDAFVAAALDSSVPLHLRGVLSWPETAWTLADWREREAATVLRMNSADGHPQYTGEFILALERAEAAEAAEATASAYTEGCLLPASWEARFTMPVLPAAMFGAAQLWFGRRREHALVTRLHCDLANSFLAQVHGRKRVRLFSPSQDEAVYALDAFNTFRPCRVDADAPDLARFPRFAEARGVDVVLEPGDLLVIPTGWFHCVWALDHVLSISRFVSDENAAALAAHSGPELRRAGLQLMNPVKLTTVSIDAPSCVTER